MHPQVETLLASLRLCRACINRASSLLCRGSVPPRGGAGGRTWGGAVDAAVRGEASLALLGITELHVVQMPTCSTCCEHLPHANRCADGVDLTACMVLDATGHARKLIQFDKPFDPGYQASAFPDLPLFIKPEAGSSLCPKTFL